MPLDYAKMFADVNAELDRIHIKETNLEQELASLASQREAMEATYNAVAPLVGKEPLPTLKSLRKNTDIEALKAAGISVAVRFVLDSSPDVTFAASAVRDRLAELGWGWENYSNPQATVYTTLVRLAASGAAKESATPDGRKGFYSSKRSDPVALSSLMKGVVPVDSVAAFIASAKSPIDEFVKASENSAFATMTGLNSEAQSRIDKVLGYGPIPALEPVIGRIEPISSPGERLKNLEKKK